MEREVRYCTTEDGVRIAYCVTGEGPPLLMTPRFVTSFSLSHLVPMYEDLIHRVAQGRQLIEYDMRGTGLSQREVDDLSYAATLWDAQAVVRALGLKRFSLWGINIGGPRALEYAGCHPRQVDRLILTDTFARLLDVFSREMLQGLAQLARANWEVARRTLADLALRSRDEQEGLRWADVFQKSISAENMATFIEINIDFDVTHRLPSVKCPTLVLHYTNDPIYPFSCGQRLAEAIPTATFVPLEGSGTGVTDFLGFINQQLNTKGIPRTSAVSTIAQEVIPAFA